MNITSEKWNQIEEIKGYLVQGSNGEFCYLNEKERIEMIEKVCQWSSKGASINHVDSWGHGGEKISKIILV